MRWSKLSKWIVGVAALTLWLWPPQASAATGVHLPKGFWVEYRMWAGGYVSISRGPAGLEVSRQKLNDATAKQPPEFFLKQAWSEKVGDEVVPTPRKVKGFAGTVWVFKKAAQPPPAEDEYVEEPETKLIAHVRSGGWAYEITAHRKYDPESPPETFEEVLPVFEEILARSRWEAPSADAELKAQLTGCWEFEKHQFENPPQPKTDVAARVELGKDGTFTRRTQRTVTKFNGSEFGAPVTTTEEIRGRFEVFSDPVFQQTMIVNREAGGIIQAGMKLSEGVLHLDEQEFRRCSAPSAQ